MNEFSVITVMLSKRGDEIGATDEMLLKQLGYEGEEALGDLYRLLDAYAKHVEVIGLRVEQNPLNGYWFLSQSEDTTGAARINPFQGRSRLASTLIAILIATASNKNEATISSVKKIRNVKDISIDLKDLENMGLIKLKGEIVNITDKIGFYVNLPDFIKDFNQFLKEKYKHVHGT
nr:hypothetical protein [Candidatus Sigynarchaeota archaeon]